MTLTVEFIETAGRGMYADGTVKGLYLQVRGSAKSWLLRFKLNGRERWMGLGSLADVSLDEARVAAIAARKLRTGGTDPIEQREKDRAAEKAKAAANKAKAITFGEYAATYVAAHRADWSSAKHAEEWADSLERHVMPVLGDTLLADIDAAKIVKVLSPIWSTKRETASRVRGRIERVLSAAKALGYRDGPNPAIWRDNLEHLLAKRRKSSDTEHFAAMDYADVPEFMGTLRHRGALSARCLEFAILTASRASEAAGAHWREIDLKARVWTIPASRMKAGQEHKVPLTGRALAILEELSKISDSSWVFPGNKGHLSVAAINKALKASQDVTVHGFRSSFKDWCAEKTEFADWVSEKALAHGVKGEAQNEKVRKSYQRGPLLEKRRALMTAWDAFVSGSA